MNRELLNSNAYRWPFALPVGIHNSPYVHILRDTYVRVRREGMAQQPEY
jgi:hypothetical protein